MEKVARRSMVWVVLFSMVVSLFSFSAQRPVLANAAEKGQGTLVVQQPIVVLTGDAIVSKGYRTDNVLHEVAYTLEELKQIAKSDSEAAKENRYLYSALNTYDSKSVFAGEGIRLESLLVKSGLTQKIMEKTKLSVLASDGYSAVFNPSKKTIGNKETGNTSQSISVPRYYYPQFSADSTKNQIEVPTILAWANGGTKGELKTPDSVSELDHLLLMTGQLSIKDYNNSLYNKQVQKIVAGNKLKEEILNIDGMSYTRSSILLMPRAEKLYTYVNSGGTTIKKYARGVPLQVLLEGYDDKAVVTFTTSDGYEVSASGMTKKDLIAGNYLLAYEDGNSKEACRGIYESAKKDPSKYGFFTLYADDVVPAKLINSISVSAGGEKGEETSYSKSPYKHITNGGISGQDGPYNIDAITGATLTVEGPGVKSSVPMPVLELESQNAGVHRNVYTDTRNGEKITLTYEGIRLEYLLRNMTAGDNGIALTDAAYGVEIKNRNRQTIASFTLSQIAEAEKAGKPILVSYGTSDANINAEKPVIAPFVFDGASGTSAKLGNDDGCIKLVYDSSVLTGDTNTTYQTFGNMAYIYVTEKKDPGYKHGGKNYGTPDNLWYTLSITGSLLGREVNYTVKQLEDMVSYDKAGEIDPSSLGYRSEYSLANSTYWYVNEYEGVRLYELLLKSGLSKTAAANASTKQKSVYFRATDGYTAFDRFTLEQLADIDSFGLYEKNPEDPGDGSFQGSSTDLRSKGFPVLVAYGVNRYPYVQKPKAEGYLSGLSNDGGPLRIISGKMNYAHANGSNQAKLLDKVVVGEEIYYSTHKYNNTKNGVYQKLAKNTKLDVNVLTEADQGKTKKVKSIQYSLGELENLLYAGTLTNAQLAEAKVKEFYEVSTEDGLQNDLYEGIDLSYFLTEIVQLSGKKGEITFINENGEELTLDLEKILNYSGVNGTTGIENLKPALVFAKNGAPMVSSKKEADGYEGIVTLENGYQYKVNNNGGPLCLIIPKKKKNSSNVDSMFSVKAIQIKLTGDPYAHIKTPYQRLAKNKITIFGAGTRLSSKKKFTVADLEDKQSLIATNDYSIRTKAGEVKQIRYRGIKLYDFLKSTDVMLKSNADKIIITCKDGTKKTFSLADITKSNYKNLPVVLAYGSSKVSKKNKEDGMPLVESTAAKGYKKSYQNSGGPLMLVVGQKNAKDINSSKQLKNIVSIEVTASKQSSWKHSMSAIYQQYENYKFILEVVNKENKKVLEKSFSVKKLEAMSSFIERDDITWVGTQEWEGINLWKLIQKEASTVDGIENPSMITAFAEDGFNKELRSIFSLDALKNGIKDGERRVPILLSYAVDGYPLVPSNVSDGFTSLANNSYGPLRLMTHGNQGACLKNTNKVVVKVTTEGKIVGKQTSEKESKSLFQTYLADGDELPLAGIRDVSFDKKGGMWVGTYGGGMAYLEKGAKKFVAYNKESNVVLKNTYISALAADQEGGVWFSQNASYTDLGKNEGVGYLKNGKITYYSVEGRPGTIPDNYVQAIEIDSSGAVWFGSFGGITRYQPKTNTWKTWTKKDGLPAASVNTIVFDQKGGVWIGCYPDFKSLESGPFTGGYAHLDAKGKITAYPAGKDEKIDETKLADVWVRGIALDKDGGAWIVRSGSYANLKNVGGRVDYVAPNGKVTHRTGKQLLGNKLQGNTEIRIVSIDQKGNVWYGTSGSGLFYCTKNGKIISSFQEGSESPNHLSTLDNIYTLDFQGNSIYVGSSGGLQTAKVTKLTKK